MVQPSSSSARVFATLVWFSSRLVAMMFAYSFMCAKIQKNAVRVKLDSVFSKI